jgi:hypothetical protein
MRLRNISLIIIFLLFLCLDNFSISSVSATTASHPNDTLEIAVMGPPSETDEVEQNMYRYLGQRANIDYILLVNTKEDFFKDLEKITKDGKKINYLIIAGHGESQSPHIALGSETILPLDLDIEYWVSQFKENAKRLSASKRDKCNLMNKTDLSDEEKKQLEKLSKNIVLQEKKIAEAQKKLSLFDSVSDIMAQDAVILLINCSTAATEDGIKFATNLGRIFLGKYGGKVIASTIDVSVDQVSRISESIRVWLGSGEKTKDTAWKGIGEFFILGDWKEIQISAQPQWNDFLYAHFKEFCVKAEQYAPVILEIMAEKWKDSGKFGYSWSGDGNELTEKTFQVETKEATDQMSVSVLVKDEKGRSAEETAYIKVTESDLLVDLQIDGPDKTEVEKEISLKALTKAKNKAGEARLRDISIEWIMKNEVINTGESFRFSATQEGSYTAAANAVRVIKGKKEMLASASHTIAVSKKEETDDTGKLSFGGTASDIWEGGNTEDGFHLKRKKAETGPGSKDCQWTGYVGAEAWGKIDPSFAPKSQEEIASRLREEIEDHKKWGRKAEIRQFVIGDFKGEFVDTSVKFRSGGWAFDSGYRGCEVNAYGYGYIMKGYRVVELAYSVSGGGCFDNSHRPFLESQAATAQGEAKAILAGLQLIRNGSIKKEPYKGPKLDGSDLPKVILVPAQIEKLKVGDVVKIQAVVENAKPEDIPFKYAWTGEFEGSGDTVRIKPAKPGKFTLSVSVDGAQYNIGSASVEYEVADYKVNIERLSPDNKPVPVGGKIRFKAVLTSEGKPATGNFIYRWQPHPEVSFSPFEDSSNETEALFTEPGKLKVWVQAIEQKGEVLSTIAESDQLEIQIIQQKPSPPTEQEKPSVDKEDNVTIAGEQKKNVSDKVTKVKQLLSDGKLDEAIAVAEEAAKINRDAAKPVIDQLAQESKKLGWRAVNERDFKTAVKRLGDAVRLNPEDKDAKEKFEKAKQFSRAWDDIINREIPELDRLINEKKPFSAHKQLLRIQEFQHDMPGGGSSEVLKGMNDRFYKAMDEYNVFSQEAGRKHTEYFKSEDWDAMLKNAQEMTQRELSPPDEKEAQSRIQFAQQRLGERTQAWNYYLSAKAVFDKGDLRQASEMLRDLKNKPIYFMKNDPRRQQIADLIAAIEKGQKIAAAKDYARTFFRLGEEALKGYNYEGASKHFAEGLKAIRDNGDMKDPDYTKYYKLYEEAVAKDKRIKDLWPGVSNAAMTEQQLAVEKLEKAQNEAKEMLALQPNNTDIQIYKNRLDMKLKNMQDSKLKGEQLWNEGRSLFDQNRPSEALGKFKESLKYLPTPEHTKYVQELETTINKNKEMAKKLRAEGEALQNQNRLEEAVAKYRESLKYLPDSKLEEHIKLIEAKIAETSNKKQTADSLWKEGTSLYKQKRYTDALNKFKESVTYWSDQKRQEYVKQLEAAKAAAKKLRDEGEAFQNQGKLQDAVSKYRESVKTWPNPSLEEHIIKVENEIRSIEDKKACAKKNRDEGAALQQQNRLSEALAKYKASYACRPTPEMQEHIKKIETAIATPVQPDPNDIHYVKGFQGKWNSNWGTLEFKVNGVKVEGNYTHDKGIIKATLTGDKKTMEGQWLESPSYSPPGDGGKVTFTLSPDGDTITGKWGYGDNLNGGDWTGTRVKDVTTPVITPPEPPKPPVSTSRNLTGKWTANCGDKDSYVVTISHYGNTFDAEADREAYKGTIEGNIITGKSYGLRDTISGEIVSDNEIRITVKGTIGDMPFTNNCTLRR